MAIPRETIEIIRERALIEEIIARYVPSLKKRGNNFVGLCPFHKEKTPSFTVSPQKQIFHCFGCHAGGNIFSFISKIEKVSFPESVRIVGKYVGVEVKDNFQKDSIAQSTYSDLFRMNTYAMKVFHAFLASNNGEQGLAYLMERGLNEESIETFQLGFTSDAWNALTNLLKKHNVDLEKAASLGLLSSKDKGDRIHYYDRFRQRIMFPIIDQYEQVAGFGGRIIEDGEPKYLNSPDSDIFKKRQLLYGLHLSKHEITELNRAIIVEGYLDVIGCHQEGIKNVVAPLGTALTSEQVKILSRYCSEIILLFDADSAGIKASLRSLDILKEFNLDVKVAQLPESDPFEFIQKKGIREFMAVVDSALKPIDFKIEQTLKGKHKDTIHLLLDLFEIIGSIDYETEQVEYLKKISILLKLDFATVNADYMKFIANNKNKRQSYTQLKANNKAHSSTNFVSRSHKDLIILLCYYPYLLDKAVIDFNESDIQDQILRNIFSVLGAAHSEGKEITLDRIFDLFPEGKEKSFLEESIIDSYSIEDPGSAYTEIYIILKLYEIDKKIDHFAHLLKQEPVSGNMQDYLTEIEVWRREKEKLSSYLYNLHNVDHIQTTHSF